MLKTLACLALFALPFDPCSTLTVTGTGAANTNLVFALDGAAANSMALMVIGDTTGQFSVNLGQLGTLELGLLPPFAMSPMGFTNASGDASLTVRVPRRVAPADLHAQGFSVEFDMQGPSLRFCTSNVATFHIGN